jgi:hypothetical protein
MFANVRLKPDAADVCKRPAVRTNAKGPAEAGHYRCKPDAADHLQASA